MAPHNRDRDQFDDLLDSALKRYADVEPRAGLEGRVLANLAADASRTRARWAWAVAGACAMALVVAVWVGIVHHRTRTPEVAVQPRVIKDFAVTKAPVITEPPELNEAASKRARARRTQALANVVKTVEPRLEQFPSPRPLSQQEQLLIAYVTEFPKQAAEVAQEQTKRKKEFEAMYPVTNPDSDSNQER